MIEGTVGTIRAVVAPEPGDGTRLEWREIADPGSPGPAQVRVAVKAVGIGLVDQLMLRGGYEGHGEFPRGVGLEYAGTVTETGADIAAASDGLRPGDAVCGMVFQRGGALCDALVLDANDVARAPDGLNPVSTATLPSAAMTAYAALHRHAHLQAGERVLILSGASGVGVVAIQMAAAAGAYVTAVAGGGKHARLEALGAHWALDSTETDWGRSLDGFDVVLDPVGGPGLQRSYDLLNPGGRLICLDAASQHPTPGSNGTWAPSSVTFDPVRLVWDAKAVMGVNITASWLADGGQQPLLAEALDTWQRTGCRAVVGKQFDSSELAEAFEQVTNRSTVGRVVVAFGPAVSHAASDNDPGSSPAESSVGT